MYNDSTYKDTDRLAEARGVSRKIFFSVSIRFNYEIWLFPPQLEVFFAKIVENKFITSYEKLRRTNIKRNSWVYQKFNFDLFYRQISITTVRGPLVLIEKTSVHSRDILSHRVIAGGFSPAAIS